MGGVAVRTNLDPARHPAGGVADQLSEHAVAPAALVDAVLAARGV